MKILIGGFLLLAISPLSVLAQSYSNNCEFLYWAMNKENPEITLEQYQNAQCQTNDTRLIRRAERYKLESLERDQKIEDMLQERIASARGERSGKVVRRFEESDFNMIPENPTGMAVVGKITIIRHNKRDKNYETSPDHLCKKLGYEKSLEASYNVEISDDNARQREIMPDRLIEFREVRGFRNASTENHDLTDRNKGYGVIFQTFASVTCEKTRLANDPVEEFEIDIEALRRTLQSEVDAPELDEDVERILSLGRSTPQKIDNDLGENDADASDEDEYRPTTWDSNDNPFVYQSQSK